MGKQEELTTHSGRQLGGAPIISGRQLQAGLPSTMRQSELLPQGEGSHGLAGISGTITSCRQALNGSPTVPGAHSQVGTLLITMQFAPRPQTPGHGSRQNWLIQLRWLGHSFELKHSGLQPLV